MLDLPAMAVNGSPAEWQRPRPPSPKTEGACALKLFAYEQPLVDPQLSHT